MKKTLAVALAALLIAWPAAPAPAASRIDFSGYYKSYFLNDWNQNRGSSRTEINDSYFVNRLNLDFGFHPTDEVSVYWALRAPANQRWGGSGSSPGNRNGSTAAETYHLYGTVRGDWGSVSVGRLAESFAYAGLYSLGWTPGGVNDHFTEWGVFDYALVYDGLRYAKRWDNGAAFVAQFYRMNTAPAGDEQSNDWLILHPSYRWDGGGATLSFILQRDHVASNLGGYTAPNPPTPHTGSPSNAAMKAFYIGPTLAHSWGDFSVHFEGKVGWGKHYGLSKGYPLFNGAGDRNNGQAFYLDFNYNYGPGNVMLAGWWVSGTGQDSANGRSLFDMGPDFLPLIVAYDTTAKWSKGVNGAIKAANARSAANRWDGQDAAGDMGKANNHWALALNGAHSCTDDVTLTYTLAHLALNEVAEGRNKSIGFEADLGLAVELLDNLEFRTTFGYLFAGDALKFGNESPADSCAWYNTMTFSF